jgi:hypothetical protein
MRVYRNSRRQVDLLRASTDSHTCPMLPVSSRTGVLAWCARPDARTQDATITDRPLARVYQLLVNRRVLSVA